jgi:hypothetical protein
MKNRITKLTINSINYCVISLTIASNIILPGWADNPVAKNGNPCIEELCINDEVKSLINLKWKKVPVSNSDYTSSLGAVGDPNAVRIFSRYWSIGRVDSVGLQALSKIKGFCRQPILPEVNLKGEYINKKGQPVVVNFNVVPSPDGKSQKFIVTNISKVIQRANVTPEQEQDLAAQAQEKYKSYYQKPFSGRYPSVNLSSTERLK